MAMAPPPAGHPLALLLLLLPLLAAAKLVLEDGYTVTTFSDLNPLTASGPHPYAILPRPRAGDLLLLDSAGSALYTLALSAPGEPRRLAGGRRGAGFDDGGPGDAALDRPSGVAVDGADNVYVVDRVHVVGHLHGVVRKVAPDGLGTTSVWVIAIVCALLGLVIGFLVRHFYPFNEVSINCFFSRIQKQYQRTQRKATLISFCDIKSGVASSMAYTLLLKLIRVSRGYLAVVFPSVRLQREVPCRPSRRPQLRRTSTSPNIGLHNKAPLAPTQQLGDLISFAGDAGDKEDSGNANSQEGKEPSFDCNLMGLVYTPQGSVKKIDHMIEANLTGLSAYEERCSLTVSSYSISRRRVHGDK